MATEVNIDITADTHDAEKKLQDLKEQVKDTKDEIKDSAEATKVGAEAFGSLAGALGPVGEELKGMTGLAAELIDRMKAMTDTVDDTGKGFGLLKAGAVAAAFAFGVSLGRAIRKTIDELVGLKDEMEAVQKRADQLAGRQNIVADNYRDQISALEEIDNIEERRVKAQELINRLGKEQVGLRNQMINAEQNIEQLTSAGAIAQDVLWDTLRGQGNTREKNIEIEERARDLAQDNLDTYQELVTQAYQILNAEEDHTEELKAQAEAQQKTKEAGIAYLNTLADQLELLKSQDETATKIQQLQDAGTLTDLQAKIALNLQREIDKIKMEEELLKKKADIEGKIAAEREKIAEKERQESEKRAEAEAEFRQLGLGENRLLSRAASQGSAPEKTAQNTEKMTKQLDQLESKLADVETAIRDNQQGESVRLELVD